MKKYILNISYSLLILSLTLFIFIPYFTADFLDLRQKKENEENQQRLIREELALKKAKQEAELKIYLTGKFDPAKRPDFSTVPPEFNISGYKTYLRNETLDAFLMMREAALRDKIDLKIASATRNFDYQKMLWNNKWTGAKIVEGQNLSKSMPDELERFAKILEYSAVPGTSRHHWGTEVDINGADPAYFNTQKGIKEYDWLAQNAYLFGFCQTYNLKGEDRQNGYNEEKWHWSYLPIAKELTQEYKNLIREKDITGFLGDEHVASFDLINNYVLSINRDCL